MRTEVGRLGAITLVVLMVLSIGVSYTASKTSNQFAFAQLEDSTESKNGFRKSDNPLLYRLDEEKWVPIMPPKPSKVQDKDMEGSTDVVIYDVKTQKVKKIPKNFTKTVLPLEPLDLIPAFVIPPDDRVRITSTTDYPWSTICKLFILAADGALGVGTGFIIDEFHILTAGHCVYLHDHGGWAESIIVVPALNDTYQPYWIAWMDDVVTYTGWVEGQMYEHDWALLTLDRNVGIFTDWMEIYTSIPEDPVYTGLLDIAGYPGELDGGMNMYWDADLGWWANEYNHWYYMDMSGGQSGGPVWFDSDTRSYALSINAYSDLTNECSLGTRIDGVKFDDIISWCSSDIPPTDYANMIDDGQDYSGFGPVTVTAGVSNFDVWADIRNIGTADTSNFYVSYYASIDAEITTSDYLIGVDEVTSITPFTWTDSDWSGTFPNIPAGTYYVGWIIDSTDVVPEPLDGGEGNNVAYKESYQLNVLELNLPPVADAGGPYSVSVGSAVPFDGTGSIDTDGIIVSYFWAYGDGTFGVGATASHSYAAMGIYTVILTVTDDDGATDVDTSTVTVVSVPAGLSIDYVMTTDYVERDWGKYRDTMVVLGSGVNAGTDLELGWDSLKTWDGEKGILNVTMGEADGSFEVWFDVPKALYGPHYLWVRDKDSGITVRWDKAFIVLPHIKLSRRFAVQGSRIEIDGYGFVDNEYVILKLGEVHIQTFNTDTLGGFTGSFTVPAIPSGDYKLKAEQPSYGITVERDFKVGLMIVILSPSSGPVGTMVTLSGTGFTEGGSWTATLGGITIIENGYVNENSDLELYGEIPTFYVPNIEPGLYTLTVLDIETNIEIKVEFEVTGPHEEYDIILYEGWNLIGLPFEPEDPSIEVVLLDILPFVESVWAYDGGTKTWSSYAPGAPSDLTEMHLGKGYWIKVNNDVTWTFDYP